MTALTKITFSLLLISLNSWSQSTPGTVLNTTPSTTAAAATTEEKKETTGEKPNGKRIRRQLNLVVGLDHDEEFLVPDREFKIGGRTDFFDINRIKGTDFFRISPKKKGNGITTLIDKKTGQILVEIRFDIRDDNLEKTLREVQAMLSDIEGIETKVLNDTIYIDGFVLLPRDLVRIAQVISTWPNVKSLATLSPVARQKIANFISNDVNNPEVKITAIGDYIKLEGQVNSEAEKTRITEITKLYLPDLVIDQAPDMQSVKIMGKKNSGKVEDLIINLITVKSDTEKVEPPPKMIQIVTHFVKFGDTYGKSFSFNFSPAVSAQGGSASTSAAPNSTVDSTINLIGNLLPKLNWAKVHGFAKVLDTASILIQDKLSGNLSRNVQTKGAPRLQNGQLNEDTLTANITLSVTPTIKSERSGLIELKSLNVSVTNSGRTEINNTTSINTTISVRDRQSAAFGGVIKKSTDTNFGAPTSSNAIITFNAAKQYDRVNSQFVVFVTPIIKSSASSGVEQVKKKFRLRD